MTYYPQRKEGARAPLFDRLIEAVPHGFDEPEPVHTLDRRQLAASVRRELVDLLNTRASNAIAREGPLTTLEYGLADYTGRRSRDPRVWLAVSEDIRRGVTAFEPRLRDVRVEVSPDPERGGRLRASISCGLLVDEVVEPVSFTFSLGGSSASDVAVGTPDEEVDGLES